jgi:hypothetical protein
LRDISNLSKKVRDGEPTKFGFAQVINIVLRHWFPMDEVQNIEVDFEEALDKDELNKCEVNVPIRGDFKSRPSSCHIQLVLVQI